jgi:RsiW-degrading membrane proteinase PrsW (M82 family)
MVYANQNEPNQAIVSRAATITFQRKKQTNVIGIAFLIVGGLVALLLGLLTLLVIGIDTGPIAFLIGMVAATIPVPLYVILVIWIDRYESEPFWMLATAFLWGALVAPFFAFLLNTVGQLIVSEVTGDKQAGELYALVVSAPVVEESGKAAILFLFFFLKKDEFDGVIDGIVYASLVALGFAMTENIHYYGTAALRGTDQLTLTFFIRGAMAPFSHPLFTSLTGIGLGLARQTNKLAVKLITPLIGFMMAMCMHSIWNGSGALFGGVGFLLTYILIMVPAFVILLVVIAVSLKREGQVVREFLMCDLETGILTRQEYDQLGSIFGRMGSSFNALRSNGVKGWRQRMQFNQMASELAFHRCRVTRRFSSPKADAHEVEQAYIHILNDLLRNVRSR